MMHILFDVDGVLINNFHIDPAKRYLWWEDPAHKIADPELMNKHFFGPRWPDILTGKKKILPELQAALQEMELEITAEDYLKRWLDADSKVNTELLGLIRKLPRENIKLSLATNQEHERAAYIWNELNFKADFDEMFYAAQLGVMKPDTAFFITVASKLDIQPTDQVIFFDDTPKCTTAAQTLDWNAVTYSDLSHFTDHPIIKNLLNS